MEKCLLRVSFLHPHTIKNNNDREWPLATLEMTDLA